VIANRAFWFWLPDSSAQNAFYVRIPSQPLICWEDYADETIMLKHRFLAHSGVLAKCSGKE
jgi:hypothetical protein